MMSRTFELSIEIEEKKLYNFGPKMQIKMSEEHSAQKSETGVEGKTYFNFFFETSALLENRNSATFINYSLTLLILSNGNGKTTVLNVLGQ